ncbi:hypothetical protein J8V57_18860 [Xenorhabdus sp. PB61.4]|uniref:hypothetical protein n=1 Tax=Xenorhabdus TaxID=626 RepID=UPI001E311020|nr:hypothetical protein [Xenorhabdus sp. PB61.4]MCC8368265.1 hypothetical protein [Xenorhabdus sp. PB61.4]
MKIDNKAILLTRQQMDALRQIQQDEYSRSELGIKPTLHEVARKLVDKALLQTGK